MKRTLSADPSRRDFWHRIDWVLLALVTICSGASVLLLRALWTENISGEVDSNDWIVQLISLGLGIAGCIAVSAVDYHKLARFWFLLLWLRKIMGGYSGRCRGGISFSQE